MAKKVVFILGGVRSGKSRFAQELAKKLGQKVLFVATGQALDEEMKARIEEHKKVRPSSWRTLELSNNVGKGIKARVRDAEVVIVDCLTLLVSNLLKNGANYPEAEKRVLTEIESLISCLGIIPATFIIVSNEVGMGIVPKNKLARLYRDLLGKVNQLIAEKADEIYLMVAGIAVRIEDYEK